MTLTYNLLGAYFALLTAAGAFFGWPLMLPAVTSAYFLLNTPVGRALSEDKMSWYSVFILVDLCMTLYAMTFHSTAMNITAVLFMIGALLTLFPMLGIAWAERLYELISYILIIGITLGISAHIAIEAAS